MKVQYDKRKTKINYKKTTKPNYKRLVIKGHGTVPYKRRQGGQRACDCALQEKARFQYVFDYFSLFIHINHMIHFCLLDGRLNKD